MSYNYLLPHFPSPHLSIPSSPHSTLYHKCNPHNTTTTHLYSPSDSSNRSANVNPLRVLCGGVAAATAKTLIAPLNRLTIILQSQGMPSLHHNHSVKPAYTTIMSSLSSMVQKEGIKSLWNGNGTNVLRVLPNYGLRFGLNDISREWVAKVYGLDPSNTKHSLTKSQLLLSSSLAGIVQITLTYPIEVIATRLTVSGSDISPIRYNGMVHCITDLIQKEGFKGLYNGYPITLLAGTPYVAIQMSCYELFQRYFHELFEKPMKNGENSKISQFSDEEKQKNQNHQLEKNQKNQKNIKIQSKTNVNVDDIGFLPKVFAGASASLTAQTITYPGDILRRRMQVDGMGSQKNYAYRNIGDAVKKIWKNEGWKAFFKGIHVNSLRIIPEGALVFVLVDGFKKILNIEKYDTN